MSLIKKLASDAAIYGLSSVLGRVLNYLLVPIYTGVFLPADYGVVTELYAFVAFLNVLYAFGLETTYFRFASKDETKADAYFNTGFTHILLLSVFLSCCIWLFSDSLAALLRYPEQGRFVRWLAIIMLLDAIVALPFARLRRLGKSKVFAVLRISNIAINISLNLFFIVYLPDWATRFPNAFFVAISRLDLGVGYIFLSNLIANGLYLLFFFPTWLKTRLSFDWAKWKSMMKYAWPIVITGFAGVTNEMLSRAILKYHLPIGFYPGFTNQDMLGIFGACYKLAVFMALAVQAFRYAFEPFFFAQSTDKQSPQLFSRVMTVFVWFTAFSWLVLSLFLPYYAPVLLRQAQYLKALDAVPWLLGAGLFLGVFYNLSLWYKLTDKTFYGSYLSIIGAAVTVVLNLLLIPIWGYMGCAVATFVSYLTMVVVSYRWGCKHYFIPYETGKLCGVIFFVALAIGFNRIFPSFISSLCMVLLFLTFFVLSEYNTLRHLASKIKNGY